MRRPVNKLFYDVDGHDIVAKTAVIERSVCPRCREVEAKTPLQKGSAFGPDVLRIIIEWRAKGLTDAKIAYLMDALYNFQTSANAIWNARDAIAKMFKQTV